MHAIPSVALSIIFRSQTEILWNDRKKLSEFGHDVRKRRIGNTLMTSFNTNMGKMSELFQQKIQLFPFTIDSHQNYLLRMTECGIPSNTTLKLSYSKECSTKAWRLYWSEHTPPCLEAKAQYHKKDVGSHSSQ